MNTGGGNLDEEYLEWRPAGVKRKDSKFGLLTVQDCATPISPSGGLPLCLGRFLYQGYKAWELRVNTWEQYLLHYKNGEMDLYVPTNNSRRRWTRAVMGHEED
jgi:hypothetical protein